MTLTREEIQAIRESCKGWYVQKTVVGEDISSMVRTLCDMALASLSEREQPLIITKEGMDEAIRMLNISNSFIASGHGDKAKVVELIVSNALQRDDVKVHYAKTAKGE
jgi:hypothetical protein